MSNKDELLANFQAGTGIDDVGKAFTVLESCDWDLSRALNSIMNGASSFGGSVLIDEHFSSIADVVPSLRPPQPEIIEIDDSEPYSQSSMTPMNFVAGHSRRSEPEIVELESYSDFASLPSTSHASASVPSPININIQLFSTLETTNAVPFPLELPATTTVEELKSTLYQIFGLPICEQVLEGFVQPVLSHTVITENLLPENKTLTLIAGSRPTIVTPSVNGDPINQYNLLVHDEMRNQDFNLHYAGSDLVKKVKADVCDLTKIPIIQQIWIGWPPSATDNDHLGSLGIRRQLHLTVRKKENESNQAKKTKKQAEPERIDDSSDEYDDAIDMIADDFIDMEEVPTTSRRKYLIPPHVENEETGVDQFCNNFRTRFGQNIPSFYNGTLENALKDSVMLPAKAKRLLAVYIHHDGSIVANVFCSEILCHQSVMELLGANYLIWGWDISHESNKARLLNLVSTHFGSVACSTIRSFTTEKYPALLLLNRTRGIIEILSVIHGTLALDELVTGLLHVVELFEDQRSSEIVADTAREERQATRAEQDAAYEESLIIDRAKALAKRTAELEAEQERGRVQALQEKQEAIKNATRTRLEASLPVEPSLDSVEPKTIFRFRTPSKESFQRAFLLSNKLEVVLNYLCVKGFPADEFKCLQSWPRRDITTLDTKLTLADLKMPTQETLTIEER